MRPVAVAVKRRPGILRLIKPVAIRSLVTFMEELGADELFVAVGGALNDGVETQPPRKLLGGGGIDGSSAKAARSLG